MKTVATLSLSISLLATACASQSLVGTEPPPGESSDGGSGTGSDATSPAIGIVGPGPVQPVETPFTIPDALVGWWTGYFEAFTLTSGSDKIALNLMRTPDQPDRVTFTLGEGPAPSTDGATPPWPTDQTPSVAEQTNRPAYFEGFAYTAHAVRWIDRRLTFVIEPREPMQPWCQMQPSYQIGSGTFSCLPANATQGTPKGSSTLMCFADGAIIPCNRFFACQFGCQCDATGCAASTGQMINVDVTFDAPVTGATSMAPFRLDRAATTDGGASGAQ